MTDLFGHPLPTHGLDAITRARMFYAAGDACSAGSAVRAEYYRAAAQAQRKWDEKQAIREAQEDKRLSQMAATRSRFARSK